MSMIIRTNKHPYRQIVNDLLEDNRRRMGIANEFENKAFGLAIDVDESDDGYTVRANLPGVNLDDINVHIHDDVLSISAEVNAETQDDNTRALVRERRNGKFTRSLRFPAPVSGDAISASFNNGVLNISVPKAEEAKPRHIPVNAVTQ
jgi:HSP20 family protein